MRKLAITLFLILVSIASVSAQGNKIASINSEAFYDENSGIIELVEAKRTLETEFEPQKNELINLYKKIEDLKQEFKKLVVSRELPSQVSSKTLSEKIEQHDFLIKKLSIRRDEIKMLFKKREAEVIEPVKEKIKFSLKKYVKQNRYIIVVNTSKEKTSDFLVGEIIDITKMFIEHYNKSN